MRVLSLFDGIGCGKLALDRVGVKNIEYFASEIDRDAITVMKYHHRDAYVYGDVTKLCAKHFNKIDLLIGGSPCQSFSQAGSRKGFDGKSGLFWEYVRMKNELNPKYFLLENVMMKEEWRNQISEALGVQPIAFNSKLVSAQDRPRLYWTNIPFELPKDKGYTLESIVPERSELPIDDDTCRKEIERYTSRNYVVSYQKNGNIRAHQGDKRASGISEIGTVCHTSNKSPCLIATHVPKIHYGNPVKFRKLTVSECEALQTLPIGYTDVNGMSDAKRHKLIGNGWTVDVIAHIMKSLA